jgi:hypothetical protein
MTNPKNREELDEYKELSSSEEERLLDNQPSAAEATEEEECRRKGRAWNPETRKCEKSSDQGDAPPI